MLDARQIDVFFERGFLVLPGVFREDEVAEMRAAFERLEREAQALGRTGLHRGSQFVLGQGRVPGTVRIDRIVWCGAAEPVLARYGADPRLLRAAACLLGSNEMCQLINQAHFKLPNDGVEFPWHQDSTHRRHGTGEWTDVNGRGSYVQTITAIDDVTAENGPLELAPSSWRVGHVAPPPEGEGRLPDSLSGAAVVAPTMAAGSVLLFGPYTFHRSLPNRSDRPRRVFINGYASPGANRRVYPGEGSGRVLAV
jgi:ectoine hydroxylase-related dioxygenase (phytanoyl-CoA dioxygenase family)